MHFNLPTSSDFAHGGRSTSRPISSSLSKLTGPCRVREMAYSDKGNNGFLQNNTPANVQQFGIANGPVISHPYPYPSPPGHTMPGNALRALQDGATLSVPPTPFPPSVSGAAHSTGDQRSGSNRAQQTPRDEYPPQEAMPPEALAKFLHLQETLKRSQPTQNTVYSPNPSYSQFMGAPPGSVSISHPTEAYGMVTPPVSPVQHMSPQSPASGSASFFAPMPVNAFPIASPGSAHNFGPPPTSAPQIRNAIATAVTQPPSAHHTQQAFPPAQV